MSHFSLQSTVLQLTAFIIPNSFHKLLLMCCLLALLLGGTGPTMYGTPQLRGEDTKEVGRLANQKPMPLHTIEGAVDASDVIALVTVAKPIQGNPICAMSSILMGKSDSFSHTFVCDALEGRPGRWCVFLGKSSNGHFVKRTIKMAGGSSLQKYLERIVQLRRQTLPVPTRFYFDHLIDSDETIALDAYWVFEAKSMEEIVTFARANVDLSACERLFPLCYRKTPDLPRVCVVLVYGSKGDVNQKSALLKSQLTICLNNTDVTFQLQTDSILSALMLCDAEEGWRSIQHVLRTRGVNNELAKVSTLRAIHFGLSSRLLEKDMVTRELSRVESGLRVIRTTLIDLMTVNRIAYDTSELVRMISPDPNVISDVNADAVESSVTGYLAFGVDENKKKAILNEIMQTSPQQYRRVLRRLERMPKTNYLANSRFSTQMHLTNATGCGLEGK